MNVRVLLLCLFWTNQGLTQGFSGLGTDAVGYAIADREYQITFPQDHLAHPDFRIEWWYITATLTGADGQEYGIQWTLFRSASRPGGEPPETIWADPQIWMGHAGLTTPDRHFSAERLARGGIGQAGVTGPPFEAYIDNWYMRASGDGIDRLDIYAQGTEFSYQLDLQANGPLIFHGDAGYSVKSPEGQASHYYSQPFYEVSGVLILPEGPVSVTGDAWLDREWSSQPLSADQEGWDWISLHFDDGARLMGFRLRGADTDFTSASWIDADGTVTAYGDGHLELRPLGLSDVEGREIPTEWQVIFPERGVDVTVSAMNPNAWMDVSFPYWEGPVDVAGTQSGRGYLEMTGYAAE